MTDDELLRVLNAAVDAMPSNGLARAERNWRKTLVLLLVRLERRLGALEVAAGVGPVSRSRLEALEVALGTLRDEVFPQGRNPPKPPKSRP